MGAGRPSASPWQPVQMEAHWWKERSAIFAFEATHMKVMRTLLPLAPATGGGGFPSTVGGAMFAKGRPVSEYRSIFYKASDYHF
ncbi:Hypothetical protein NTJ_08776 [Nesidiocoris tenuis]|uniref:Uncharacterized protein n=1 Tax=Nesidiocoris tenuis TaxID=355587 RepID=A0ABN7AUW0_9HEMI|nr:Hypothetical protein NTJ_08776 [Nesidiocoris tenuis]